MITVRYEAPEDLPAIREVNQAAFERVEEADLVDRLRAVGAHVISLVAVVEGRIVGHILFSPVTIEGDGPSVAALGLAPVAVLPEFQRKGVGSTLVWKGLEECLVRGYPVVVVMGHPGYYPRFGFVPSRDFNLRSDYDVPPEVFMVKELKKGVLKGVSGTVKYHPALAGM